MHGHCNFRDDVFVCSNGPALSLLFIWDYITLIPDSFLFRSSTTECTILIPWNFVVGNEIWILNTNVFWIYISTILVGAKIMRTNLNVPLSELSYFNHKSILSFRLIMWWKWDFTIYSVFYLHFSIFRYAVQ